MLSQLYSALFLLIPIVIGGVLHMFILTYGWLAFLKIPVYPKWFGANKTWHGFIVMPLVTILGVFCAQLIEQSLSLKPLLTPYPAILLGLALGLGYIIFELPNSFIKRRLGVPPGETPQRFRYFFILIDQLDSAFGFILVYYFFIKLHISIAFILLLIFPFVALIIKRLLFILKLKKHYH